jgi:hypothetical protein
VDAEVILPSVMPNEFADNHAVELEICMRWFSSDAGQVAKTEAPLGYTNVRAMRCFIGISCGNSRRLPLRRYNRR